MSELEEVVGELNQFVSLPPIGLSAQVAEIRTSGSSEGATRHVQRKSKL